MSVARPRIIAGEKAFGLSATLLPHFAPPPPGWFHLDTLARPLGKNDPVRRKQNRRRQLAA